MAGEMQIPKTIHLLNAEPAPKYKVKAGAGLQDVAKDLGVSVKQLKRTYGDQIKKGSYFLEGELLDPARLTNSNALPKTLILNNSARPFADNPIGFMPNGNIFDVQGAGENQQAKQPELVWNLNGTWADRLANYDSSLDAAVDLASYHAVQERARNTGDPCIDPRTVNLGSVQVAWETDEANAQKTVSGYVNSQLDAAKAELAKDPAEGVFTFREDTVRKNRMDNLAKADGHLTNIRNILRTYPKPDAPYIKELQSQCVVQEQAVANARAALGNPD